MANMQSEQLSNIKLLLDACDENDEDRVIELIKQGANVNEQPFLFHTIVRRQFDISRILIEKGANVNYIHPRRGLTPLMCACEYANVEFVNLLIDYGAELNVKDKDGLTALMRAILRAALSRCTKIIELLIHKGADIHIMSVFGSRQENALTLMLGGGYLEPHYKIVELFVKKGIDCSLTSHFGLTPFETAIYFKDKRLLEILVSNSSNIIINDMDVTVDKMIQNGWSDMCLKILKISAFQRRKHLIEYYYKHTIY